MAASKMDAERFPYRNTPSRASFYRVVNLFKKKKKCKGYEKTETGQNNEIGTGIHPEETFDTHWNVTELCRKIIKLFI